MLNGFDRVARFYDFFARLVYGNSIVNSQVAFLHVIRPKAKVFILGGGTGWILDHIVAAQPDCEIVFIDASARMIELARKKVAGKDSIEFIHGTEENIGSGPFDVVLTPFFLDMFTAERLAVIVPMITKHLNREAVWLVADFSCLEKYWQRALLRIMYTFFRAATKIEAKSLPDWNLALTKGAWNKGESEKFYGEFIEAAVYRRS